tara:strand:- start:743 stop:1651 length:909 start_codon:yes stop_codon:yes gene_type:complete
MAVFVVVLILIFSLGYLAQFTGLCMVRGVNEWKNGNPSFLLAILFSGVLAWVAAVTAFLLDLQLQFRVYEPSFLFAIGGLLFGLGAAFNQGCGVSTLTRFSRGELAFGATVLGWLLGWTLLAIWRPEVSVKALPLPTNVTYGILIILSLFIGVWALRGDSSRKKTWLGMMGIGLLAGFIFLYQPNWPPSGLLHDLSQAIIDKNDSLWPEAERFVLFVALLLGMMASAWKAKKFKIVLPGLKHWSMHLISGVLMGIGASLSMGGNDSQLLLALPTFSIAGIISVTGMIIGLFVGLDIRRKLIE